MKDTLSIVQKIAEVAKVITKIFMVFAIVGSGCCVLGMLSLALVGEKTLDILGATIHGIIVNEAGISFSQMYCSMITAMFILAGEAVKFGFGSAYLKNELADGTPFTLSGAKELLRLGILLMAITLGTSIIVGIVEGIFNGILGTEYSTEMNDSFGIICGAILLAFSFVVKLGAEKIENKEVTQQA